MDLLDTMKDFLVETAFAQDVWRQYYAPFGGPGAGTDFINNWAIRAANLVLKFITGGAVLAIMWGGIKMITSAGNEEGKESAKKIIFFAVAGLLLAIMSLAVTTFTHTFISSFT